MQVISHNASAAKHNAPAAKFSGKAQVAQKALQKGGQALVGKMGTPMQKTGVGGKLHIPKA